MPKMGMHAKVTGKRSAARPRRPVNDARMSLIDALFSTTQQRVLALLSGQPDRSFFTNELIELTKSGSGGVQRELRRSTDSGLVTTAKIGNQRHFQANHAAPVYQELRSIVLKTVGLGEPLREVLIVLADRIRFAGIYGFVAKRTGTASGDVDLLIVSDDLTLKEIYSAIAPVEGYLARKINPTVLTEDEFRRRREIDGSFVNRVLAGSTSLW
jgi:predicted nucleotidyltransferase